MQPDGRMEAVVDKIVSKTESAMLTGLQESLREAQNSLAKSQEAIELERERLIEDGKKEADKIRKQVLGSSNLEARNQELLLVGEAIDAVFERALDKVKAAGTDPAMIKALIKEASEAMGTGEIIVSARSEDAEAAKSALSGMSGAEMDPEPISCIGGIRARSKNGSMKFDNTIDARFDRMKPLLRKEIAAKFGLYQK